MAARAWAASMRRTFAAALARPAPRRLAAAGALGLGGALLCRPPAACDVAGGAPPAGPPAQQLDDLDAARERPDAAARAAAYASGAALAAAHPASAAVLWRAARCVPFARARRREGLGGRQVDMALRGVVL